MSVMQSLSVAVFAHTRLQANSRISLFCSSSLYKLKNYLTCNLHSCLSQCYKYLKHNIIINNGPMNVSIVLLKVILTKNNMQRIWILLDLNNLLVMHECIAFAVLCFAFFSCRHSLMHYNCFLPSPQRYLFAFCFHTFLHLNNRYSSPRSFFALLLPFNDIIFSFKELMEYETEFILFLFFIGYWIMLICKYTYNGIFCNVNNNNIVLPTSQECIEQFSICQFNSNNAFLKIKADLVFSVVAHNLGHTTLTKSAQNYVFLY